MRLLTSLEARVTVEGVEGTPAVVLFYWPGKLPRTATLEGKPLESIQVSESEHLVWLRFVHRSFPRELDVAS